MVQLIVINVVSVFRLKSGICTQKSKVVGLAKGIDTTFSDGVGLLLLGAYLIDMQLIL
jgi:hypothetical protein